MRLFLDSVTRVFRGQAPEGATTLTDILTANTVEVDVSDDDWTNLYYPLWLAGVSNNWDLVIDVFGGTALVPHIPSARESAIATLYAFSSITTPTLTETSNAVKAAITFLEIAGLLADMTIPPRRALYAAPIRQVPRRVTRARPRSFMVGPAVRPPSSTGRIVHGVRPRPPRQLPPRRS